MKNLENSFKIAKNKKEKNKKEKNKKEKNKKLQKQRITKIKKDKNKERKKEKTMNDCIFCKIIKGEIPSTKVFENDDFIIVEDISKKAAKHFLALPKTHLSDFTKMPEREEAIFGKILKTISTLENDLGLGGGYRLVINKGENAGQTVFHLHIHIIGGEMLGENFGK